MMTWLKCISTIIWRN